MRSFNRSIVALTVGDDTAASSRIRVGAPMAVLEAEGYAVKRITAQAKVWPMHLLASLLIRRPHVTVIQKVAPPGWYMRVVASLTDRLVFECDDAIQLGSESTAGAHSDGTAERLRILLPLCDRVIVSNSRLAQDFRELGAKSLTVFPGPAPRALPRHGSPRSGVVWLGSPSTIDYVRSIVYPAMSLLPPELQISVVGAEYDCQTDRVAEYIWTPATQNRALHSARVGLAPQPATEWSMRKAFFKVLEYIAADVVPVVPAHPAVQTLLGDELTTVAVVAPDDSPSAWSAAIERALQVETDLCWTEARDRVLDRWSPQKLSRVITG